MAFGNRTSKSAPDSSGGGSKYSGGKAGASRGSAKPKAEFIKIGDITARKKLLDENELYGEIVDALDQSGYAFNLKVYLGKNGEELTLKNGDFITLTFKRGDKSPDFVLGTASLAVED